ncbi:MAG: SagB/ThcOx family dehydrogenase [Candidatus Diapherotrites archaeon]
MINSIRRIYKQTKFKFEEANLIDNYNTPLNWIKIFFKTYPRMKKIQLKIPEGDGEFYNLLINRNSIRDFKDSPISLESLNKILFYSLGLKNPREKNEDTRRFYPSAGARYPIEAYLLNNNTNGLDKGLYHYNIKDNQLEQLLAKDVSSDSSAIFGESYKGNSNFIILNGVISRTEVKYGANAYRFALLEAGHIGQNISLLAEKEKIGCCAIGGFDNDKLSKLIDITQEDEIPLYAFSLGNPLI